MEVDKARLVHELALRDQILAAASRESAATYQRDTAWYLLAAGWFHRWTHFLASFASTVPLPVELPGPMTLAVLLTEEKCDHLYTSPDNPFNLVLKQKLVIVRDYYVLDAAQWNYLRGVYTSEGDMEIKRFGPNSRTIRLYAKSVNFYFVAIAAEEVQMAGPCVYKCHPELTAARVLELIRTCELAPEFIKQASSLRISIVPQGVFQSMERASIYERELLLRNNDLDLATEKWVEKLLKPNSILVIRAQPPTAHTNRRSLVGRISESPKKAPPFEVESVPEAS
jgi:hypothetical protein